MPEPGYTDREEATQGDDFVYPVVFRGIPSGQGVAKAWMTVKTDLAAADNAASVMQKMVDTNPNPGVGQITDSGITSGAARFQFEFTQDDTANPAGPFQPGALVYFDIQIRTTAGKNATIRKGVITVETQTTKTAF